MRAEGNLKAYLALGAICIIWGTTYLALRVGVTQFPPFLFSFLRFVIAAPVLLIFVFTIGKRRWPDRRTLFNQAMCGLLMITLGISVVGYAEVYVSSGVAAIICSMMPVWTILINLIANNEERPNRIIVAGLAIGLAGIVMIFGEHLAEFGDPDYQFGIALIFVANISWAYGSIWIKKHNTAVDPFMGAGLQMLFGALFLIPLSLIWDDYSNIQWSAEIAYVLLYMALIGSVAAYACYSYAIKKLPITLVSLYAYVNPVVAVVLGWLVLNEKLNYTIGIAIALTVAGIYVVTKGYQMRNYMKTLLSKPGYDQNQST